MANQLFDKTFERLERGGGFAKKSTHQVKKAVLNSAGQAVREATSTQVKSTDKSMEKLEKGQYKGQNFTSLNWDKLHQGYQKQDDPEVAKVRERLHYLRLVHSEEKKAVDYFKQKEAERKRLMEEEEKAKKIKVEKILPPMEAPKGKERKSIFSRKTKKKQTYAEVKPGGGKQ